MFFLPSRIIFWQWHNKISKTSVFTLILNFNIVLDFSLCFTQQVTILRTFSAPRPYHPRSMLASGLRHPRMKFALSAPLYPASNAAKRQVCFTPVSRNPMLLSLLWSEGRAKEERRTTNKKPAKHTCRTKISSSQIPNTRKRKVWERNPTFENRITSKTED